jgi:ribosomal protein L21
MEFWAAFPLNLMAYAIIKTGGRQFRVAEGDTIDVEVLEQRKDKKVIAFKYKRRKGYHRTVGHRRKLTRVKIKSISLGAKKGAAKKTEE